MMTCRGRKCRQVLGLVTTMASAPSTSNPLQSCGDILANLAVFLDLADDVVCLANFGGAYLA